MYAQTQLIPATELAPGMASTIRNNIINSLIEQAAMELSIPPEKLIVRDIQALNDLDYTYEDWVETVGATAAAYETMTTGTLADQRFIGIYGIKLKEGSANVCSMLRFVIGGAWKAIWQLQSLSKRDDYIGFCPSGVIIPQNTIYTIERYVRMISVPFYAQLKGVVIERRGRTVNP